VVEPNSLNIPFVTSVLHPSDFSAGSEQAFAHALAIALLRQTRFTIIHAGRRYLDEDEWTKFPPVRATLERWGLLKQGSPRSAVFDELAVKVKKVNVRGLSPLGAILDYLDEHATDLIVLATEGREGLPRWIRPSAAQKLARQSSTMTLFVPNAGRGFVSLADGELSLRRILVAVDQRPDPRAAITYAGRAATRLGDPPVATMLLHVGDADGMSALDLPDAPGCSWQTLRRSGDVVEEIVRASSEHDVDLIVMTTRGPEGVLDALRGSVTEQVLRRASCPLLAVPAAAGESL
jgi:nucleotide-binding universal stress UspA family protein